MNIKGDALSLKMGGQTTPAFAAKKIVPRTLKPSLTSAPLKRATAGANAQTDKYGKAMAGAFKNTKTFGMPGVN